MRGWARKRRGCTRASEEEKVLLSRPEQRTRGPVVPASVRRSGNCMGAECTPHRRMETRRMMRGEEAGLWGRGLA